MNAVLVIPVKLATPSLLKITVFWSKYYDVITSAHDITSKFLSRDSSHVVDLVMWLKFANSERSYLNFNFIKIWPKKQIFEGLLWFKFNGLELKLNMALKLFISVVKRLKLNARMFWGQKIWEKLVRAFLHISSPYPK